MTVRIGDKEYTEDGAVAVTMGRLKGDVRNYDKITQAVRVRSVFNVADGAWLRNGKWHGDFGRYSLYKSDVFEGYTGMLFNCPGCGAVRSVQFKPFNEKGSTHDWNEDADKPTVSDTLSDRCGWYGALVNGQWIRS